MQTVFRECVLLWPLPSASRKGINLPIEHKRMRPATSTHRQRSLMHYPLHWRWWGSHMPLFECYRNGRCAFRFSSRVSPQSFGVQHLTASGSYPQERAGKFQTTNLALYIFHTQPTFVVTCSIVLYPQQSSFCQLLFYPMTLVLSKTGPLHFLHEIKLKKQI